MVEYYNNLDLSDIIYWCEVDLVFKTEKWLDAVDYEGIYKISDLGRLKSLKRLGHDGRKFKEKILSQSLNHSGYYRVALCRDLIYKTNPIHKIVAMAFLGHKPCGFKLVINHKNLIKTDNRLINLEIVTNRENSNQKHLKSSSQYVGVYWYKPYKKWRSNIVIDGKKRHLGYFDNEYEAHLAYEKKVKELNENPPI